MLLKILNFITFGWFDSYVDLTRKKAYRQGEEDKENGTCFEYFTE